VAADPRLAIDRAVLDALLEEPMSFTGNAVAQVDAFCAEVERLEHRFPTAAGYQPHPIL
jgi:adenylosuccinate lyase